MRNKPGSREEPYLYTADTPLGYTDDLQSAEDMVKLLNSSGAKTIGDYIIADEHSRLVIVCNTNSEAGQRYLNAYKEYWHELGQSVFGLPVQAEYNLAHFKIVFDMDNLMIPKPHPREIKAQEEAMVKPRRDNY